MEPKLKSFKKIKNNKLNDQDEELTKETNKFIKKVTQNLENFSYNKIIANMHEIYSFWNKQIENSYSKETIIENFEKILLSFMPVIPHFSNECLKLINSKNFQWPIYSDKFVQEEVNNIVVQVNGKKED